MLTENALTARGLIPVAPIRALIERWSKNHPDARQMLGPLAGCILGNTGQIALLTGLSIDCIKSIRQEVGDWIEFDKADKIVCALGEEWGWHSHPDLWAVYEKFDLAPLDRKKPTTVAA